MFDQSPTITELFVFVILAVLPILVFSRIFMKAGFSGFLSLLLYIPVLNIVLIIWFAFAEWPIEKKLKALQSESA